jgi:hypothetical protein
MILRQSIPLYQAPNGTYNRLFQGKLRNGKQVKLGQELRGNTENRKTVQIEWSHRLALSYFSIFYENDELF